MFDRADLLYQIPGGLSRGGGTGEDLSSDESIPARLMKMLMGVYDSVPSLICFIDFEDEELNGVSSPFAETAVENKHLSRCRLCFFS